MDEKKVRKAVGYFKELSIKLRERGFSGASEHCDLAIEALEKQLPEKPIFEGDGFDELGDIVFDEWLCPLCNARYEVDYQEYDYCPSCGQKLDWSE